MIDTLLSIVFVILAENLVFSQMLTVFGTFDVTVSLRKTMIYGCSLAISSVLAAVVCAPLRQVLHGATWLLPILAVLAGALFSVLVLFGASKLAKSAEETLRSLLPLVALNSAVIVLAVLYATETVFPALISVVGAALSALLALLVFFSVRERMRQCEPPSAFRGIPIYLAAAGMIALAFAGFAELQF